MIIIKPLPKTEITTGIEYHDIRYDKSSGQILPIAEYHSIYYGRPQPKVIFSLIQVITGEIIAAGAPLRILLVIDATLGYRFRVTRER